MPNVFVPSANDPAVFTSDKFALLKDGDGNSYRPVVKANVNGSIDVYSKGTGAFGGDELLFQYSATRNGADFTEGKFRDKPTTAFNSFFRATNSNGEQFTKDVKTKWYSEAPPNAASRMATLSGYRSIAATTPARQTSTGPTSLTIRTGAGTTTITSTPTPTTGSDPTTTTPLTSKQQEEFDKEKSTIKGNTREKYDSIVVYPIGLDSSFQDCIKFSIIEYKQSGLKGFVGGDENLRRVGVMDKIPKSLGKDREILSTIVLPIPGGIQDANTVNWSGLELPDLQQALGNVMTAGMIEGKTAETFRKEAEAAAASGSGLRTAIVSNLVKGVLGDGGVIQRQFGTIINPNLELLFNNPDLRTFNFSFKLSPRSSKEAEKVRKIIRYFKQSMSVKRSKSSMLLQTPHTFAISYIFQNKEHPYLNKFKECALTNCSVNYTPEGNYMSFDDSNNPSMVSYQLDLQFQELEPIYDDDYTAADNDTDTLIGY